MEGKYNTRSPAVKRLMKEAQELSEPTDQYYAQPLDDNLFEWHFTVRGPSDSDFQNGIYHGRIILPVDYPMKPPSIIWLTPNGRFETNKKICLSISGHHPESWQPSWSIRTALLAIIGFMPTHPGGAIGSLDYKPEERKVLAKKSKEWKCPSCGDVSNILLEVSNESSETSKEAKELAAQINFQAEKSKSIDGESQNESTSQDVKAAPVSCAAAVVSCAGATQCRVPPAAAVVNTTTPAAAADQSRPPGPNLCGMYPPWNFVPGVMPGNPSGTPISCLPQYFPQFPWTASINPNPEQPNCQAASMIPRFPYPPSHYPGGYSAPFYPAGCSLPAGVGMFPCPPYPGVQRSPRISPNNIQSTPLESQATRTLYTRTPMTCPSMVQSSPCSVAHIRPIPSPDHCEVFKELLDKVKRVGSNEQTQPRSNEQPCKDPPMTSSCERYKEKLGDSVCDHYSTEKPKDSLGKEEPAETHPLQDEQSKRGSGASSVEDQQSQISSKAQSTITQQSQLTSKAPSAVTQQSQLTSKAPSPVTQQSQLTSKAPSPVAQQSQLTSKAPSVNSQQSQLSSKEKIQELPSHIDKAHIESSVASIPEEVSDNAKQNKSVNAAAQSFMSTDKGLILQPISTSEQSANTAAVRRGVSVHSVTNTAGTIMHTSVSEGHSVEAKNISLSKSETLLQNSENFAEDVHSPVTEKKDSNSELSLKRNESFNELSGTEMSLSAQHCDGDDNSEMGVPPIEVSDTEQRSFFESTSSSMSDMEKKLKKGPNKGLRQRQSAPGQVSANFSEDAQNSEASAPVPGRQRIEATSGDNQLAPRTNRHGIRIVNLVRGQREGVRQRQSPYDTSFFLMMGISFAAALILLNRIIQMVDWANINTDLSSLWE
ncbi:unnamed protein product [Lymnaea stagnalis]|uniref:UBC core domain-containing protein n=1 Tax=Lymnaea stagnalis TaxID=6523 RepID=A0AAV2HJS7_LYMST